MQKQEGKQHAILIISASEQFQAIVKRSLQDFLTIEWRKSGAMGRRCASERDFDLVVVDAPLPDEAGEELAMDIAEKGNRSVLIVVPQDIYEEVLEQVTDVGILAVSKPFPRGRIDKAIRFLVAVRNRMIRLEKKSLTLEEKMEAIRTISRAKLLLVEKKHMTEDEAHRYIGKLAMNNGVSRDAAAEKILAEMGNQGV